MGRNVARRRELRRKPFLLHPRVHDPHHYWLQACYPHPPGSCRRAYSLRHGVQGRPGGTQQHPLRFRAAPTPRAMWTTSPRHCCMWQPTASGCAVCVSLGRHPRYAILRRGSSCCSIAAAHPAAPHGNAIITMLYGRPYVVAHPGGAAPSTSAPKFIPASGAAASWPHRQSPSSTGAPAS